MPNKEIRDQAIVIDAINFGDYDKIITLLTFQHGILSAIVKRGNSPKYFSPALISPLTIGEYVLREQKGELLRFLDGSILDPQMALREDYDRLECAGKIVNTIKTRLLPNKKVDTLYLLTQKLLYALQKGYNPRNIYAVFLIKFLLYEGLISQNHITDISMLRYENEIIKKIISERSITKLAAINIESRFAKKIYKIFEISFH